MEETNSSLVDFNLITIRITIALVVFFWGGERELYSSDSLMLVERSSLRNSLSTPNHVIDRRQIELSGKQSLLDFWDETIYAFTIGSSQMYINGRRTLIDIDTIPLAAIERIEINFNSSPISTNSMKASGYVNFILRESYEGTLVQLGVERPEQKGFDSEQFTLLWGDVSEDDVILLTAEHKTLKEGRYDDRGYSRSLWKSGGNFAETRNVSFVGNTVFALGGNFQDANGNLTKAVAIGNCRVEDGYTGKLKNPFGVTGDGCGFPWANSEWLTDRTEKNSVHLISTSLLDDTRQFSIETRFSNVSSARIKAPAYGNFLLSANSPAFTNFPLNIPTGSTVDVVDVYHQFIANGNREDLSDTEEFSLNLGLTQQLKDNLSWNTEFQYFSRRSNEIGNNYVNRSAAIAAVSSGRYDLHNPLSQAQTHRQAVEQIRLQLDRRKILSEKFFRTELAGQNLPLNDYDLNWKVGVEVEIRKLRDIYDEHLYNQNVFGSGFEDLYAPKGELRRQTVFAELGLQTSDRIETRLNFRTHRYAQFDLSLEGGLEGRYQLSDKINFRASWIKGSRPPEFFYTNGILFDIVNLTPASGLCIQGKSICQFNALFTGNPNLHLIDVENFGLGASVTFGSIKLFADYLRTKYSGLPVFGFRLSELQGASQENSYNVALPSTYFNAERMQTDKFYLNAMWTKKHRNWDSVYRFNWSRVARFKRSTYTEDTPSDIILNPSLSPRSTPRDQVSASVTLTKGNFAANWSIFHQSGYHIRSPYYSLNNWTSHNLTFEFNQLSGKENLTLSGGVLNATNSKPSIATTGTIGFNFAKNYVLKGRTYFVRLRYAF